MSRSVRFLGCLASIAVLTCSGPSPAGPILPTDSMDGAIAVVAGRVVDSEGAPVPGALVQVNLDCSSEGNTHCRIGSSVATDADGRFAMGFETSPLIPPSVAAEVEVQPPLGLGYELGSTTREGRAVFQTPPVADTTYVEVVLPSNQVDSRRPVRVVPIGHLTSSRPLLADGGRVYISTSAGIAAMVEESGACLWQEAGWGGRLGPPYVVAGEFVVVARGSTLTALRAGDGETVWNREGVMTRSLTAGDGLLYASDSQHFAAYDLESGATLWTRELIGRGSVEIAAGDDLACAEILAYVECWQPESGEPTWSRPTDFVNWLAIAGDRVILGEETGWSALDAETGASIWSTDVATRDAPAYSPTLDLLFACTSAECFGVEASDGIPAWRTPIPNPRTPATDGTMMYVVGGDSDNSTTLFVLDAASGTVLERILPDPFDRGGFEGTPAVGRELLFVFGGFDHLYAFERP